MMRYRTDQQGFSLIELMTVTATVGFVMAGFWQMTVFQAAYQDDLSDRMRTASSTSAVLLKIAEDVETAGYGLPILPHHGFRIPTDDAAISNQIVLTKLDAGVPHVLTGGPYNSLHLDSLGVGSGMTPVGGSDELILASTLFDNPGLIKGGYVIGAKGDMVNGLHYKPSARNSGVGAVPEFDVGDKFVVYNSIQHSVPERDGTWPLNQEPVVFEVTQIDPSLLFSGSFDVIADSSDLGLFPQVEVERGVRLYQVDPIRETVGQRAPKVQYVLDSDGTVGTGGLEYGTLKRVRFIGSSSDYSSGNLEIIPLLDNVVQFQVQFLVWPCQADSSDPVWMDDPDNDDPAEFGLYSDLYTAYDDLADPSISQAYRARRSRISAVRITIARLESLDDKSRSVSFSGLLNQAGITSMQVQNELITGIPDGYSIQMREIIVDPINFRFRDGRWFANSVSTNNNLVSEFDACGI